jgi:hypothetical protein
MNKMRFAGIALPVSIGAIIVGQMVVVGLKSSLYASWAFLFFMGAYLGRFLYLRSQGREAAFFSTRIRPTDSGERRLSTEWVALAGAVFLVVLTLLLPVLRA